MPASMLGFLVKIIKGFDKVDYLKLFHLSIQQVVEVITSSYLSLPLKVTSRSTPFQIGLLIAGIVYQNIYIYIYIYIYIIACES